MSATVSKLRFLSSDERRTAEYPVAPLNPEHDWAAWVRRWEPAYLWHSTALQVAHQVAVVSHQRCRVASEERHDERGRYWVWKVTMT